MAPAPNRRGDENPRRGAEEVKGANLTAGWGLIKGDGMACDVGGAMWSPRGDLFSLTNW